MPQSPSHLADNSVVVEERSASIFCSLPGRFVLANRRNASGKRRQFACRVISISPHTMTLFTPVNATIGERVTTYTDEFGELEGSIIRVIKRGFVIAIAATNDMRTKLIVKIDNYELIKNHDLSDRRKNKRIVPENPNSTLILADGTLLDCFIINASISGVAVSADIEPEIGTPLAVGNLLGRVARRFPGGFAVQFMENQNLQGLEQKLVQL